MTLKKKIFTFTLLSTLLLAALLFAEYLLRALTDITTSQNVWESIQISLTLGLLIAFSTKKFKILLSLFIFLALTFQSSNAFFYGGWIDPVNLYLLFENLSEVVNILPKLGLSIILKSLAFIVASMTFVYWVYRLGKNLPGYKTANVLILVIFLFQPIRDGVLYPEKIEKRFTKDTHSLIRSFHNSYGIFASMLISDATGGNLYSSFRQDEYPDLRASSSETPNIFIYFGESLSSKYMGEYGYHLDTTPILSQLIQDNDIHTLSRETIAGAAATMPSSVRFFHMIDRPDARKQASSFNTSLFRYAKLADYQTAYLSTQGESYVNHIYKLVAGKYSDYYFTPPLMDSRFNDRQESDDRLAIEQFAKLELEEPFFAVLQPNGSHAPFDAKSPHDKKIFGTGTELQEYENSVHYTDANIKILLEQVKEKSKSKPWIIFITSDHGTHVDGKRISRSLDLPASYMVPGIVLTNSQSIYDTVVKPYADCKKLLHKNFSEMIAKTLNRDVPVGSCDKGVLFNGLLNGYDSRFVDIDEEGAVKLSIFSETKS
ncbi:sulfatase-like hydrolase/transferase [Vibrio penaeicida]|uniref:sulfatase-like hydrolase/transferase n=1 Tax=Vibrio penaeicida TaxID=104609 RepID=UPI0027345752|nr:sulfatase-like hydrolase/transferase [Vibrio penaeicida]MDP2573099.1 sulfatase-like hydrolase/transferase [Vibrio penaeicida]